MLLLIVPCGCIFETGFLSVCFVGIIPTWSPPEILYFWGRAQRKASFHGAAEPRVVTNLDVSECKDSSKVNNVFFCRWIFCQKIVFSSFFSFVAPSGRQTAVGKLFNFSRPFDCAMHQLCNSYVNAMYTWAIMFDFSKTYCCGNRLACRIIMSLRCLNSASVIGATPLRAEKA